MYKLDAKGLIFSVFFRMRLSAGRQAYHHGNRLGWLGYGQKPRADIVGPKDGRAFRNIKLSEVISFKFGFYLEF